MGNKFAVFFFKDHQICGDDRRLFFFFFGILNDQNKTNLKLQLLEEPFVLAGLISLLEFDLGVLLRVGSLKKSLLTMILSKGVATEYFVGHEVIIIVNFHKRLDL